MINYETVRFIAMLNELAELTKNKALPFEKMTTENRYEHLFYDENTQRIINDDGHIHKSFKIVQDSCVCADHHDVISHYGDSEDYEVLLHCDDEIKEVDDYYVVVTPLQEDIRFIVQDGHWEAQ